MFQHVNYIRDRVSFHDGRPRQQDIYEVIHHIATSIIVNQYLYLKLLLILISEVYGLNNAVETLRMGISSVDEVATGSDSLAPVPTSDESFGNANLEEEYLTSLPPPPRPQSITRAVSSSTL